MTSRKCKEISSAVGDFNFRPETGSTSHESIAIKIGLRFKNGIT
jgi:uncharacterized protein (UPF0264 family)